MIPQSRSPGGTYLARCSAWRVLVWKQLTRPPIRVFANGYRSNLTAVSWSPDGSVVAAGGAMGEVLAWSLHEPNPLLAGHYPCLYDPIIALGWSPVDNYLAALTEGNRIQVWDLAARQCLTVLSCRRTARRLIWSSNGLLLQTNAGERWVLQF